MPKQPDPPLFHNANPGGRMLLPIFWTAGSKNYREAGQLALMGEPNQMYARDATVYDVKSMRYVLLQISRLTNEY